MYLLIASAAIAGISSSRQVHSPITDGMEISLMLLLVYSSRINHQYCTWLGDTVYN